MGQGETLKPGFTAAQGIVYKKFIKEYKLYTRDCKEQVIKLSLAFLCLFCLFSNELQANPQAAEENRLIPLSGEWMYRWGGSRSDISGPSGWEPIDFPSNPPDRNGRTYVWFAYTLPDVQMKDPRLFVHSIDINGMFYLDGKEIYRFGDFDEPRQEGTFRGWPWHLIELPDSFGGKRLTVQVFSDYRDIGLWGDLFLGSGYNQLRRIYRKDAFGIMVWTISIIIFIVFIVIFFFSPFQTSSLYLALITLSLSLYVLAHTYLKQYLLNAPLFWEFVKIETVLAVFIFISLFIKQIIGRQIKTVSTMLWITCAAGCTVIPGLVFSGLVDMVHIYTVVDVISVAAMAVLAVFTIRAGSRGKREAQIIFVNFLIMGAIGLFSIMVSNGVFPYTSGIKYIMLFQFSLGLAFVLGRRFFRIYQKWGSYASRLKLRTRELCSLNADLEAKVRERTRQLEEANITLVQEKESLHITSITDGLTGLYNRAHIDSQLVQMVSEAGRYQRCLSVILFDIDNFKQINDSHGHAFGDEVLRRVAQIFREVLRDSDIPARYGGEEFLIILPETDLKQAFTVADRIRTIIESLPWESDVRVTISGGVAELNDELYMDLVEKADRNMYKAKQAGKNAVIDS